MQVFHQYHRLQSSGWTSHLRVTGHVSTRGYGDSRPSVYDLWGSITGIASCGTDGGFHSLKYLYHPLYEQMVFLVRLVDLTASSMVLEMDARASGTPETLI